MAAMGPNQGRCCNPRGVIGFSALAGLLAWMAYVVGMRCSLEPLPAGIQFPQDTRHQDAKLTAKEQTAFDAYAARADAAGYHHISLCSRPHPKFELLKATAAWHGDSVTALGMGDQRFQQWGVGFGVKLDQVQRWLNGPGVRPDDIVMFTDAFDVLLMGSSGEIRQAYLAALRLAMAREADPAAESSGKPRRVPTILFSTERYCWPDFDRAPEYPASDRKYEFAFLNSGTYIGPAGDLAASMASLNYTIAEDDQRYWTSLYLRSRVTYDAPRIVLDHESDLFLCMSGYSVAQDVGYEPTSRRYKFKRAPGSPVVMHFNNAKTEVAEFFAALQGAWCPYRAGKMAKCRAAASFASSALAFLLGLLAARALLAAVLFIMRRHGAGSGGGAASSGAAPGSAVAGVLPTTMSDWAPAVAPPGQSFADRDGPLPGPGSGPKLDK